MTPNEMRRVGTADSGISFADSSSQDDWHRFAELCERWDRTNELLERLAEKSGVLDPYIKQAQRHYEKVCLGRSKETQGDETG